MTPWLPFLLKEPIDNARNMFQVLFTIANHVSIWQFCKLMVQEAGVQEVLLNIVGK